VKEIIASASAPAAIGPYSQAVRAGDLVFVSGQLGLEPATKKLVEGGIAAQTRRALENVAAIVASAGTDLGAVVKTTVLLQSMDDFAAMNEVYATFFPQHPPARAAFQVAKLPLGALVEIEAVLYLGR
jgi:2-iminobutanoate/2-iminopropanoate deaminase